MRTVDPQPLILLLALAAAAAYPALSQTIPGIERCASIEAEAQRLACYDGFARDSATDTRPSVDTEAAPQQRSETPQAESSETRSERRARRREEQNSEVRRVSIVAVSENFTGFSVFTAASGEVFVETSATAARYPDAPFEAVLEPASFGSFFLVPENETNRIRVSLQR